MDYRIQKILTLLLVISSTLMITSCQKDVIGDEQVIDVITTEPTTTTTLTTGVSGMVTDENGTPMEDVTISYSRVNYKTDENGYFKINNIKAGKEGGILALSENGYFDNYKFFIPELNTLSFLRIRMISKGTPQDFARSTGGVIQVENGGSIEFPADGVRYESGDPYNEDVVQVYTHWYNPEDPYINQSMPGDLRGLSSLGQLVQLETYGMMAVEITDGNGVPLNLNENTFATIRFPLPQGTREYAPARIKTWSLNESTVYWEEENIAELNGNEYVAQVSHFSFWNCDVPYPLVNISGKLVNEDGQALSYYNICINALDRGITGYGWSDNLGGFRGKVPKNEPLQLVIKDECGNVILEQNIGPFNNDVTLGEVVIETQAQLIITGQLVCNGTPITEGYAKICISESDCYIAPVDEEGFFEQSIINCIDVAFLTVQGFDTENFKSSDVVEVEPNSSTIAVGIVQVCDELDEFIIFKIDDSNEVLITDPSAFVFDDRLDIRGSLDSLRAMFEMNTSGDLVVLLDCFLADGSELYSAECLSFSECDIDFNFTTTGNVGDLVEGTFMGEDTDGKMVMGSFKIIIEPNNAPLMCNVEVTAADCNGNAGSISLEIDGGTPPFDISINGNVVEVVNDPFYEFTGLAGGEVVTYSVTDANDKSCLGEVRIPSNEEISCDVIVLNATCIGNDGSIESVLNNNPGGDYEFSWSNGATGSVIDGLSPGLYEYTITDISTGCSVECEAELGSDENLQVFLSPQDSILCDLSNGIINVIAQGGVPPFTYMWEDGSDDQERTGLPGGTYSVTVTDANGCTGETMQEIEFLEGNINPIVVSTISGCDVDELPFGLFTVEFVQGGTAPYTYSWSNGSTGAETDVEFQDQVTLTVTDANGCVADRDLTYLPQDHRAISGIVWEDGESNATGSNLNVYDFQDRLLGNIEVRLYREDNPNNPIATVFTNQFGVYRFIDVEEGNYFVEIIIPPNSDYFFVERNVGMDDIIDSEFRENGTSEIIETDGCLGITNLSAGLSN